MFPSRQTLQCQTTHWSVGSIHTLTYCSTESQQICGAQSKLICQVKKYSRVVNKPLFKCDTSEHSLEELITELDSLTPSSNIDNKGNKLFENHSAFYSTIENEYNDHCTKTHHSSSRKPWWNSDLDTAGTRKKLIDTKSLHDRTK